MNINEIAILVIYSCDCANQKHAKKLWFKYSPKGILLKNFKNEIYFSLSVLFKTWSFVGERSEIV